MWIWDDDGGWGLPRMGVEALRAGSDTSHSVMLSLAWPDGRVCTTRTGAERIPVLNRLGRPRVLGAGPLRFECLEPFVRWRGSFDGVVALGEAGDSQVGMIRLTGSRSDLPGEKVRLRLELDSTMALPPWVQGSLEPEGHFNRGEHRFEQLFKATGTLTLNGNEMRFVGGGLENPSDGRRPRAVSGLVRALLAVLVVPERSRVRIHPLSPTSGRFREVQRRLALRRGRDRAGTG